jgi:hypothetical protein
VVDGVLHDRAQNHFIDYLGVIFTYAGLVESIDILVLYLTRRAYQIVQAAA